MGVAAGIAAGTIGASVIGAYGAKSAADTAASSADAAAQLQHQQYMQSRQDMLPYMYYATGTDTFSADLSNQIDSTVQNFIQQERGNLDYYMPGWTEESVEEMLLSGESMGHGWDERWGSTANDLQMMQQQIDTMPDIEGALPQLYNYGQGDISAQDYLPGTEVPVYDVNGNIVRWEDNSQIPEYGEVDIYSDPSYQFRLEESLGAVDAAAAQMGDIVSGNRLYDLMDTAGDMASQEYQAAYERNVTDYDIERQREAEKYSRDVFGYGAATQEEALQYGRDLTEFGYDVQREQEMYNRGLGLYGLDYGQEMDYLNRLASIAGLGQTSTQGLANVGATTASNAGNALISAGQANAAGQMGTANAISNTIGDLTSIYAMSQYQPYPPQMFYNNYDSGYYTMGPQQPPY